MDQVNEDDRFAHITKDSRFRRMPREFRKVKIDNRFKSMFSDKRFKVKYQVDKRGKPVQTSSSENLKNYYDLNSSSSDKDEDDEFEGDGENEDCDDKNDESPGMIITQKEEEEETVTVPLKKEKKVLKPTTAIKKPQQQENPDTDDSDSDEDDEKFKATSDAIKQGIDLARGEGNISSSSDEDSADSGVDDDDNDADTLDHKWGELEADAVEVKDITRRLALCNMDWDRIKAQDILVLMNSFKPQGGLVENVKIYPSDYGLKRMEEDNRLGPVELRSTKVHPEDSSDDENEDYENRQEKLRQYQINRLKYYYAVVTCDSANTANAIYEECDGLEYETSSAKIDLRFIPDDMEFDQEPKSVADKILDGVNYKPSSFVTSALNQTKVDLTWEETDPDRLKQTMRKFSKKEVDEMDLKAYLASDSDEENEVKKDGDEVSRFRSLLGDSAPKEEKVEDSNMEMEISWEPGLKAATEEAVKNKVRGGQSPWEKYLERRAEKRREKLDEKMRQKNKKGQKQKSESENESEDDTPKGVDMNDPFFKDAVSDEENYETKKSQKLKKNKKGRKEKPKEVEADPDLGLLVMDEDDQKQHFSLEQIMKNEKKKKKKKRKTKKNEDDTQMVEDSFKLDLKDDRFSAMYTSSVYNIDPSAPDYKKTKSMEAIVGEKLKRRAKEGDGPARKMRKEAVEEKNIESIQSLVKSVKAKAKMTQGGKKRKPTGP